MLDLQPIKDRLAAATPGPWMLTFDNNRLRTSWALVRTDADLIANAPSDLAVLVAEVERLRTDADVRERYISALEPIVRRLREAIGTHKRRCVIDPQPWDRDLWAVLDA